MSQRTGSTLLCRCLQNTGVAGNPNEWLNTYPVHPKSLYQKYNAKSSAELQSEIWKHGCGQSDVFGLKTGITEPDHTNTIDIFRTFPNCGDSGLSDADVINLAFPNCKHIWSTRRNKVRLAVSWWKAIKSGEFHREHGILPVSEDIRDEYSFDAIDHLYAEASMREAATQEFFTRGGIIPFTVVYEDFIADKENVLKAILEFLDLPIPDDIGLSKPSLVQLADELSEEWVQRYREEKQKNWTNRW
jgi:trehalose 2-sulfotransferase